MLLRFTADRALACDVRGMRPRHPRAAQSLNDRGRMTNSMAVSNLIGDDVLCIAPDADLFAVAEALTRDGVGVLVVGDPDQVSGVVPSATSGTRWRRDVHSTRRVRSTSQRPSSSGATPTRRVRRSLPR